MAVIPATQPQLGQFKATNIYCLWLKDRYIELGLKMKARLDFTDNCVPDSNIKVKTEAEKELTMQKRTKHSDSPVFYLIYGVEGNKQTPQL